MGVPFFELRNITKYFSKVIANDHVSFSIDHGEVLALLGENGAGKSTVMKILYGLYRADSGEIYREGKRIVISSPKDAMSYGISMIQQHFSLVPAHTVTENIILGNVHGRIDMAAESRKIGELAEKSGFPINPEAYVRDLAVGVQQKVEILKALYLNTRLLIMDEPTAVLTPQESDTLMQFVRNFTANGNSVIFITHKLREVMEVADRIIVMRSGVVTGDLIRKDTNEHELSRLMIGKELSALEDTSGDQGWNQQPVRLSLEKVSVEKKGEVPLLKNISFDIHEGEVFGIAGVSGNGQQEICDVISGTLAPTSGEVKISGESITQLSIRERIDKGLGYVPSDRQRDGMVMDMTLAENMLLKKSFDPAMVRRGFLDESKINGITNQAIQDFEIKASGPDDLAKSLSGGNQQKVIVAREVANAGNVIVFDQPTRGLDLGAIDYVHKTILAERKSGKSVLLISTELSEIIELSDVFTVMYKGEMMGTYKRGELTTEQIGLLMAGYSISGKEGSHE